MTANSELKFKLATSLFPTLVVALVALMILLFALASLPALSRMGSEFFTTSVWNPEHPEGEKYGVLSAIVGTLTTSAIALLIAAPLAISYAVMINEFAPRQIRGLLVNLSDLAAAMPTVVYGLWGAYVLAPFMYEADKLLHQYFGWLQVGGVGPFPYRLVRATRC